MSACVSSLLGSHLFQYVKQKLFSDLTIFALFYLSSKEHAKPHLYSSKQSINKMSGLSGFFCLVFFATLLTKMNDLSAQLKYITDSETESMQHKAKAPHSLIMDEGCNVYSSIWEVFKFNFGLGCIGKHV